MVDFAYMTNPAKVVRFMDKINQVGKPDKVTTKFLESIGFKSSNDRAIIPVLKLLGFVDASGVPTKQWMDYRDKRQAPAVLAAAIRNAYASLFSTYPDAHRKDDEAIRNFFRSRTTVADSTVSLMVAMFKAVCKVAVFDAEGVSPAPVEIGGAVRGGAEQVVQVRPELPGALTINVNIQLALPATQDSAIYDKLFEALRKHILT